MQIPVEDAPQYGGAAVGRLLQPGLIRRVGPEQIVEGEAVRGRLFQQMRADEHVQQLPGRAPADPGEGGGGRDTELGPRVQPEQPEEARRVRGQRPVGPGEDGTHRVGVLLVPRAQRIPQPRLVP
ncbi:hypothetical protein [Streptomyces botrytidirepellens]|uniref:hypothetical protein n=1 Tax=Streptomyces botrytidirepellens TaxID=2486417 RepID=UPI001FE5C286|nr:hypothetical protein [Streptomyces botrytidirepellens]